MPANTPDKSQTSVNLLLDPSFPDALRTLILDYVGLIELANHAFRKNWDSRLRPLWNFMRENMEKRRLKDLAEVEAVAGSINSSTLETLLYNKHSAPKQAIFECYQERIIFHFCFLYEEEIPTFFLNYLNTITVKNYEVVDAFLRYSKNLYSTRANKNILSLDKTHDYPSYVVKTIPWSVFQAALFSAKDSHAKSIVTYHTPHIAFIIKNFHHFEKIGYDYIDAIDSISDVEQHKQNFLLTLKAGDQAFYTFKNEDKRFIEKKQLDDIKELTNKQALYEFYEQYNDSLAWNQHKHSFWDKLLKKPVTHSKEILLKALEQKLKDLSDETSGVNPQQDLGFLEEKRQLQSILLEKLERIQTEQGLRYCFFHKNATEKKILALNDALKTLEKIGNSTELHLFKETLLLNNAVFGHRNLSFGYIPILP